MGVAYTPDHTQVILAEIDASDADTLRAGLHTAVTAAGWTPVATLTAGVMYEIVSPQWGADFKAKVRIQAVTGFPYIAIQFMDWDETKSGVSHQLRFESGLTLKCHVTPCQLFIWKPGDSSAIRTCVMGGIPWVPDMAVPPSLLRTTAEDCKAETPSETVTNQLWWSMSDFGDALWCETYRVDYKPDSFRNWSFRWNDQFKSAEFSFGHPDSSNATGVFSPRLFPVTNAFYYYDSAGNRVILGKMCWYGTDLTGDDLALPLYLDPLTGWSINTTDGYPRVIGQLWDAFIVSTERSDAQEISFDGLTFFNYTRPDTAHRSWFCSLFLRKPTEMVIEAEESNYAY